MAKFGIANSNFPRCQTYAIGLRQRWKKTGRYAILGFKQRWKKSGRYAIGLRQRWKKTERYAIGLSISLTGRLVIVDIDALQLQVRLAVVGSCRVDAVLVRDDFPELVAGVTLGKDHQDRQCGH